MRRLSHSSHLYLTRVYRHYIAQARQKRPTVPQQVSKYVVDSYVRLRKIGQEQEKAKKAFTYTSARTLLGVLRLSQALARLRFADTVDISDVDEALRLMEESKRSLLEDDDREHESDRTPMSKIFRLIKDMATAQRKSATPPPTSGKRKRRLGKGPDGERDMDVDEDQDEQGGEELLVNEIRARVLAKGFSETQLMETIIEVSSCLRLQSCSSLNAPAVRRPQCLDPRREQHETAVRVVSLSHSSHACYFLL